MCVLDVSSTVALQLPALQGALAKSFGLYAAFLQVSGPTGASPIAATCFGFALLQPVSLQPVSLQVQPACRYARVP